MSNFQPLEVVDCGSKIQHQVVENLNKLDVSVYHVNTQEGSPSHFSNKSYTFIIIFADNQFVHVIIK